jgi:hypothetical protein
VIAPAIRDVILIRIFENGARPRELQAGFQVAFNDKTFQVAFKNFNPIAAKATNTALRASLKAEAEAQATINGLDFSSLKSNNNKALNAAFDKAAKAATAFKATFIGKAATAFKTGCSSP